MYNITRVVSNITSSYMMPCIAVSLPKFEGGQDLVKGTLIGPCDRSPDWSVIA